MKNLHGKKSLPGTLARLLSKVTLSALMLIVLAVPANAISLAASDWMLTTDAFGGLRQSSWNEDYYFAVADLNVWDRNATYLAPVGFHVATTAEGIGTFIPRNFSGIHTYYNQGGWAGYVWENIFRFHFRFADSVLTNAYKHAGNYDEYAVQYYTGTSNFAGMVLVKDAVAPVPEPATILLLGSGLLGLGWYGRKRKTA